MVCGVTFHSLLPLMLRVISHDFFIFNSYVSNEKYFNMSNLVLAVKLLLLSGQRKQEIYEAARNLREYISNCNVKFPQTMGEFRVWDFHCSTGTAQGYQLTHPNGTVSSGSLGRKCVLIYT